MRTLVLASNSPRRKQLLENAGFKFHVLLVKVSESLEKNLTLDEAIMEIARSKASAALAASKSLKLNNILLLTADTVVVLDDEVFGKPENKGQAFEYLGRLSGKTHQVKTAVCLWDVATKRSVLEIETSHVSFRTLSEKEIYEYIETGEPMDKAGAYGIQGLAKNFITQVDGSWDNVMGLPVTRVKRILSENGWQVEKQNQ